MSIVRSTCSRALACGGNKARETLRSALSIGAGEDGWSPADGEVASPNASELDSASLHQWRSANLPKWVKPAIDGEATNKGTHRAARGDWRERATTEGTWYPGDPLRRFDSAVEPEQGARGNYNPNDPRQRKSDRLIGAMMRANPRGAKRPDRRRVSTAKGGAA